MCLSEYDTKILVLEVTPFIPTSPFPDPDCAVAENEPPFFNGYVDNTNGGRNSMSPLWMPMTWIDNRAGCGWLCGSSGCYRVASGGYAHRTDWSPIVAAESEISFSVWAERA